MGDQSSRSRWARSEARHPIHYYCSARGQRLVGHNYYDQPLVRQFGMCRVLSALGAEYQASDLRQSGDRPAGRRGDTVSFSIYTREAQCPSARSTLSSPPPSIPLDGSRQVMEKKRVLRAGFVEEAGRCRVDPSMTASFCLPGWALD